MTGPRYTLGRGGKIVDASAVVAVRAIIAPAPLIGEGALATLRRKIVAALNAAEQPSLWLASIGTAHFEFEAAGGSEAEARKAMRVTLAAHVDQMDGACADDFLESCMDSLNVRLIRAGTGARNGEVLG